MEYTHYRHLHLHYHLLIAMILSLIMLLTLASVSAFATTGISNPDSSKESSGDLPLSDPKAVVKTERVYLSVTSTFFEGVTGGFTDSIATVSAENVNDMALTSNGNIRTYPGAYFLDGDSPTTKVPLKVSTDHIAVIGRPAPELGPYIGLYIDSNGVYEFGFNAAGVAVEFEKLPLDPYTGYGAPNTADKTMRIGQFGDAQGDMYNTYKYDENSKVFIVAGAGESLTLTEKSFSTLTQDENDTISVFYNYDPNDSMGMKTLTEVYITEMEGAGTRNTDYEDRIWSEGVMWNDKNYGYDGFENPYPIQFALYDPLKNDETPTEEEQAAKYPLVIYFHGVGGGGSKTVVANDSAWYNYATQYNQEFESNTEGINGAWPPLRPHARNQEYVRAMLPDRRRPEYQALGQGAAFFAVFPFIPLRSTIFCYFSLNRKRAQKSASCLRKMRSLLMG